MRTPTAGVLLCVTTQLLAIAAAGQPSPAPASEASATKAFGALSPEAPPETAQFGFLIGEWHCKTRSMRPDGSLHDGPDATWTGTYTLDGWAIQDYWQSSRPGAKPGTNIRSFNPKTRKWDNRWLAAGTLEWSYFEAEQVGDTMVMTGGEGVDGQKRSFIDRNIFSEIGEQSWKWRKDRSFDGGESWYEGVAHIHCQAAVAEATQVELPRAH